MKEFKFCGEITEYVEIPVIVCETQKEMVEKLSDTLKNWRETRKRASKRIEERINFLNSLNTPYDECKEIEKIEEKEAGDTYYEYIIVIYKDGSMYSEYYDTSIFDRKGKFKRYGVKSAMIFTAWDYTVFGDFCIIDNGCISIDQSDIEEYGVYAGQYDVKETAEVETQETVETEIAEKVIIRLADDEGNVLCVKVFTGTYKEADEECERIAKETGFDISNISYVRYTDSRWACMSRKYCCGADLETALAVIPLDTMSTELKIESEPTTSRKTDKPATEYQVICIVYGIKSAAKSLALAKWNRRNSGQAP